MQLCRRKPRFRFPALIFDTTHRNDHIRYALMEQRRRMGHTVYSIAAQHHNGVGRQHHVVADQTVPQSTRQPSPYTCWFIHPRPLIS